MAGVRQRNRRTPGIPSFFDSYLRLTVFIYG